MTQQAAAFFSPWDPPPALVQPPQDAGLVQRITKLAEFAARNGAAGAFALCKRAEEDCKPASWVQLPSHAARSPTALRHARRRCAHAHSSQCSTAPNCLRLSTGNPTPRA